MHFDGGQKRRSKLDFLPLEVVDFFFDLERVSLGVLDDFPPFGLAVLDDQLRLLASVIFHFVRDPLDGNQGLPEIFLHRFQFVDPGRFRLGRLQRPSGIP